MTGPSQRRSSSERGHPRTSSVRAGVIGALLLAAGALQSAVGPMAFAQNTARDAAARDWPQRPVRLVVPF
ncbi:MAG: hypothetical protein H7125_04470, partial [Proteobacteria bacterium]|nr:hypothetical protein [Burkholderiales bacterium]